MARLKYQALDSRGKVHKRTSTERIYTHCVVIHFPTQPAKGNFREWPAHDRAEWAGSLELAEKNARSWRRTQSDVEVLTAERVS